VHFITKLFKEGRTSAPHLYDTLDHTYYISFNGIVFIDMLNAIELID